MPAPDFALGVTEPFFPMVDRKPWPHPAKNAVASTDANTPATSASGTASATATASANAAERFTFDDLIDIANPLQHLPIVSTLYRAITGDQIGDPEKVVGDAIYGGPLGLVSSLADVAFKHITGKDFGDTILAMVTGDDGAPETAVAAAQKPSQPQLAAIQQPRLLATLPTLPQQTDAPALAQNISPPAPDIDALNAALKRSGIDADTSARAALAYQQSMMMAGIAKPTVAN